MKMKNRPVTVSLMKNDNALENKNEYNNEILSVPVKKERSMDTKPWEEYLNKIYYDPAHPASFAGPQKLQRVIQREGKYKYQIGLHNIRKFLHKQDAYSLHKPVRRRFRRNHIIAAGKDDLWMCDLIDMVKFEKWNDGNKNILLVIDVFSKMSGCAR